MADGNLQVQGVGLVEIASALRVAKRSAERRANKEGWAFNEITGRGGKKRVYVTESLPAEVRAALVLASTRSVPGLQLHAAGTDDAWTDTRREAMWNRYGRAPQGHKDIAGRRLKALEAVATLVHSGRGLMDARKIVAEQLKAEGFRGGSIASLARWADDIEGAPADCRLPLLLPSYVGRSSTAEIPEDAWDIFKADYLRPSSPSATSCYERLGRIARERGWELPSLRTFERRIDTTLPRQIVVLAREGREALMRMFPAQIRDHGVFSALEAVNADGHRFDVFCKWPDGTIGRPVGVFWQCIGSGKMLARRIGQTENSDLVRLSFADMAKRYGLPGHAWMDNGRGFANKFLTGGTPTRYRFKVREDDPVGVLTALVGSENIHWATPYHGQAKPIERAFRDFADRVSKHPAFEGAYTGNRPDAKPENYGSRAVPIDEFLRVLDEEIVAHNARVGRKGGVCNGRSFDQVFNESYRDSAVPKATAEQLRTLLLCSDKVRSNSRDGSITLPGYGNRYWTDAVAPHAGQYLLVRFDPDDLHSQVSVYTLAGDFICDAPVTAAVGFADTQAGREHARARKQWQKAAQSQLDAERRMDAAKVAAQIPSPPPEELPQAAVVRGVFGRGEVRRPEPKPEALKRTGTDDANETSLGDFLKRVAQNRNAVTGFDPDNT
ncbi:MAG: Mu transposase C-terminal domain-containing protein [Luteimonas sp.]|nr:Mu transposase C-terminal domain-containing protein [Luteimonas sp.]